VALVNRSLARRELGDADPIGQRLRVGGSEDGAWWTVVGVVDDVRQVSLDADSDAVYLPAVQWRWADPFRTLAVRAGGDPEALAGAIRDRVRALDPDVPVTRVATLDDLRVATTARTRFALLLFQLFAGVAVVLCAVGIFGVLAGAVAERRREIGVRSALGARRGAIVRLVVGQGLRPAMLGVAAGLAAAVGLGRFLESLLFDVSSLDPVTYGGVTAVIVAVALAACWLPARRAARLDPVTVLRSE
jgi:putative ABC transport system permease protein